MITPANIQYYFRYSVKSLDYGFSFTRNELELPFKYAPNGIVRTKVLFLNSNTGTRSEIYQKWGDSYTFEKDKQSVEIDKLCRTSKWEI